MPRLNRIIEIQRRSVARDAGGGEVETWATFATVWANVNDTDADELHIEAAARIEAVRHARMRIRWMTGVDETQRVVYGDRAWGIRGIAEIGRREFLELIVQLDAGAPKVAA